jgi:hypothetical protein
MKMDLLKTLLAAAVVTFAMASGATAQNLGKVLVASGVLKLSADTERSGTNSSTIKQFIVPYAGTVRVRWQIKATQTGAFANLKVEGQIASCSDSTLSKTYVGGTCVLYVVAGDMIRVSVSGESATLAYMRNVRVYYNVVNAPGTGTVLND